MAPPDNTTIAEIEHSMAALSYIPEILARLVYRSQDALSDQDIEDLLAIREAVLRTRAYLIAARETASTVYRTHE